MNQTRRTWRPLLLILILACLALAIIWLWPEVQRQQRYIRTAITVLASASLAFAWFLFLSPTAMRIRLLALAAFILSIAAVISTVRIRGVTGDLVPILEFRWHSHRSETAAESTFSSTDSPAPSSNSADFPQFYGPHRNAVLNSPKLHTNWTTHPPRILWRQPVGPAWSGFAIVNNVAVTQEQHGQDESVVCYELLTGRRLWTHSDSARYFTTIAGEGPRATPTISSNRVFTFGSTGILNCLDLATGKLLWSRNTAREHNASIPEWGFSSSPLLLDGQVIISVGGANNRSLVACNASDGQFLWGAGSGGAGYSSPIAATLLGERQILIFGSRSLRSFTPRGEQLWEHPWPGNQPRVSLPVIIRSNQVLISSGYGAGAALIEISRDQAGSATNYSASSIWKSIALKSKFAPIFVKDDYIYGLDDGILACVELKTGQRRWKDGRYGHGQGLLVAGMILLTSERGEVILIEPDAEKLVELGRFQVFTAKTWNPPALAGEYLLLRNDQEAACLKLHVRPATLSEPKANP